jgi:hypothetical protein
MCVHAAERKMLGDEEGSILQPAVEYPQSPGLKRPCMICRARTKVDRIKKEATKEEKRDVSLSLNLPQVQRFIFAYYLSIAIFFKNK